MRGVDRLCATCSRITRHSPDSVAVNLPSKRTSNAIVSLSGVSRHSAMLWTFSDADADAALAGRTIYYLSGTTTLIHRFKPDNIMHLLHDDLLPIYSTLAGDGGVLDGAGIPPVAMAASARPEGGGASARGDHPSDGALQEETDSAARAASLRAQPATWGRQLLAVDSMGAVVHDDLYRIVSGRPLNYIEDLPGSDEPRFVASAQTLPPLTCFEGVEVGLDKHSTW